MNGKFPRVLNRFREPFQHAGEITEHKKQVNIINFAWTPHNQP